MYYVKRKISTEDARTRTQGLMPYYEFGKDYNVSCSNVTDCKSVSSLKLEKAEGDNGNWGQFVANPCFLSRNQKTYGTMLYNYYELLNMARSGAKLRKVKTKEGEIIYTEDLGTFYLKGECFSGGTEPDYLYDYAAYPADEFVSKTIDSLREETREIYQNPSNTVSDSHMYIVLINDWDRFKELANYLDGTGYPTYSAPSIGNNVHTKWAEYCRVVDDYIGKLNIPSKIFNKHLKAPKSMAYADVNSYLDWLLKNESLSGNCCNAKLWEERGGRDMIDFLNSKTGTYQALLNWLNNDIQYSIPYIEFPISLRQNFTDIGVLTNVDGVEYETNKTKKERPHGIGAPETGICQEEIVMEQSSESDFNPGIHVESLIKTLWGGKKFLDDHNNLLPGLFQEFNTPGGKMYSCYRFGSEFRYYRLTKTEDNGIFYLKYEEISQTAYYGPIRIAATFSEIYDMFPTDQAAQEKLDEEIEKHNNHEANDYIVCVEGSVWITKELGTSPRLSINCDGYESKDVRYPPGQASKDSAIDRMFRTITIERSAVRIAQTQEEEQGFLDEDGTTYFFMVRYKNSPEYPMTIPYKTGNTTNVYCIDKDSALYRGDFIPTQYAPRVSGNKITFKYVIGGRFTMDEYGNFGRWIAGTGDIYQEEYSFESSHLDYYAIDGVDDVPVYSQYIDFQGSAKEFYSPRLNLYRTGNTAEILEVNKTGDVWKKDFSYDAYLTKEDYLINFSSPPEVDVNVAIDRGGVSAFERHYKLSECNTMQDLENYANGWFFEE